MFMQTILAPVGRLNKQEKIMPDRKQTTETIPEHTTTDPNLLHTRIEVSAGKITRLEISSAPISRIPRTIISALKTAIRLL